MARRSSIAAVTQGLDTAWPESLVPDSPNCALAAAGGRCTIATKQLTTNGAATEDIFQITDTVRIVQIWGVCTAEAEGPNVTFSNCKFSIFDQANTVDMCAVVDASGIEIDDILVKQADDGSALVWMDVDNAGIYVEAGTFRSAFFEGIASQKTGQNTYIRFSYTGDANTDVTIKFFVRWQPMCTNSSVVAV